MPNQTVPSKATIQRVSREARKVELQLSELYDAMGGVKMWQVLHPTAHDIALNNDEHAAAFNLVRSMECLQKSLQEAAGVSMFLRSILEKPYLCDVLWGPSRPSPARRR